MGFYDWIIKNDVIADKIRHSIDKEADYECTSNNKIDFSIKLMALLSDKENSVICPYGIVTVLAMAAEGASKESLDEILSVLEYDSLEELQSVVSKEQELAKSTFTSDNRLELKKGRDKIELLERYKQSLKEHYLTKIEEKDSVGESELSIENISSFKAEWLYKLKRDASHHRRFRNEDESYSKPAFLYSEKLSLKYGDIFLENERLTHIKAVVLPYKTKNKRNVFEMVLVNSCEPLSREEFAKLLEGMKSCECKVVFPEFKIEKGFNLIPMMEILGLKKIFNEGYPAFDKIANQPLYAKGFSQKAQIEVDENGTTAKAVTTMTFAKTMCMPKEIILDRPFSYFLRNKVTGEILFMGKVNTLVDCERELPESHGEEGMIGLRPDTKIETLKLCTGCKSKISLYDKVCPHCGKKFGFAAICDKAKQYE